MLTYENAQQTYNQLKKLSSMANRLRYHGGKPERPEPREFSSSIVSSDIIANSIGDSTLAVHMLLSLLCNGTPSQINKISEQLSNLMFHAKIAIPELCEDINATEELLARQNRNNIERYEKELAEYNETRILADNFADENKSVLLADYKETITEIGRKLHANDMKLKSLDMFEQLLLRALEQSNKHVNWDGTGGVQEFNLDLILAPRYVHYEYIITILRHTGVVSNENR